jgi:hypothetical protein
MMWGIAMSYNVLMELYKVDDDPDDESDDEASSSSTSRRYASVIAWLR